MKPDQILEILIPLLDRFEGLRLKPYLCPAGVVTIGLGSTRYLNGQPIKLTDSAISRDLAYSIAKHQVTQDYLPAVVKLCPGADTAIRIAAITDFAYNLGIGNLRASTLRKRINEQDWEGAQKEIRRWNKAGGKVLPGLTLRREVEAKLMK